jgi:hypothetical protein
MPRLGGFARRQIFVIWPFENRMKIILSIAAGCFLLMAHPFYMSVTDLKYNQKEKSVEGSVKVFVNDLEYALKKITNKKIDLIHPKDTVFTKKILAEYFSKRLAIKINGENKPFNLIGFEQEAENFWIYIYAANCGAPKKVEIQNAILYDFLKEQINIVHFETKGKTLSARVVNPEKELKFTF